MIVRGRRPDQSRIEYPGSGLRFFPNGSSQDDLTSHLKRQGAFDAAPSERPSPFGFSLPRVRGQDARFTQLFVDDLPLADPYAALPLVEEMDLPAFDSVEATSGAAPFDLPAVASRGALRFRLFEGDQDQTWLGQEFSVPTLSGQKFGLRIAEPTATTSSLRAQSSGENFRSRLYIRQLNSRGNFRYYDDNGTPLNREDDSVIRRRNNDRVSRFAMPAFLMRQGGTTLKGFGVWSQSRQGLPSLLQRSGTNLAQQHHNLGIGRISIQQDAGPSDSFDAAVGLISDRRTVDDPDGDILIVRDHDERLIMTRTGDVGWSGACVGMMAQCRILFRGDESELPSQKLARGTRHAMAAIRIAEGPSQFGSIEVKVDAARYSGGEVGETRPAWSAGWQAPLRFDFRPYVQVASEMRPPSLLESEGDGARIIPSSDIQPEEINHFEVGVDHDDESAFASLHMSMFHDNRQDAIVIVPSSISSYRAINLGEASSITGIEFSGEKSWDLFDVGALRSGASWVWFRSKSGDGNNLLIPGVPADQGAISVSQPLYRRPWRSAVARWTSRRRGRVYRDVANDVLLPPWWVHDAALDVKWRCDRGSIISLPLDLEIGFMATNVADAMATSYRTSAGQDGKTGYSDIWGIPLPGRAWMLSMGAGF